MNAALEPMPPTPASFPFPIRPSLRWARPARPTPPPLPCPLTLRFLPSPTNPYLPQAQFALDQARKAYAAAPALSALLPREERLSAAGLRGFRLGSLSQCVYVDHAGRQHNVAPQVWSSRG